MSFVKGIQNEAIDNLIESSYASQYKSGRLEWIPCSQVIEIKSSKIDDIYYAIRKPTNDRLKGTMIMMLFLGSSEECKPTLVSEFARIYSLPTHEHSNNVSHFRRYSTWLEDRNKLICGFTEYDDNYYMVAKKQFYHYYSRYGFCTACGLFRCSPVWCICGHKQLSDGWTSNNKQLDEFIKKTQSHTNSANDAYLEWIPFDCIDVGTCDSTLNGLPIDLACVELIPLEITDETHDLYYTELCNEHPDILTTNVWLIIGVTYDELSGKYCLIKEERGYESCLACVFTLNAKINAFCFNCKTPRPFDWTTGNKSLDSFIMESYSNTKSVYDAYLQWIEYSTLLNVQEMTSLHHKCTHTADWTAAELTCVALKKIVDKQNNQLFDFHQLTKEYPEILTPDNIWIIGITQDSSTQEYYLVFYNDVHSLLNIFIRNHPLLTYMQYNDFYELKEIGSGGYRTVYTANYRGEENIPQTVILKRFKSFDEMPELFISEFRNHAKCTDYDFVLLKIYGVTQDPEVKDFMIVMEYANNGSLLSYLDQNINRLTWKDKLQQLMTIARYLVFIHYAGLVHCDLHGGNIRMHYNRPIICNLFSSRSVSSLESNPNIQGFIPFIAPEVYYTRNFTQQSDVYSFGIIMYLMATGEPPFRDRQFDRDLICDIMGGLQPLMPDSAPEEYKKLAKLCCDADPDKRPMTKKLLRNIEELLLGKVDCDGNTWGAIYHNDAKQFITSQEE